MSDPEKVNPEQPISGDPSGTTVGSGQPEGDSVQETKPGTQTDADADSDSDVASGGATE